MDERGYFIPLPENALLRVRYQKDRDRILHYGSQIKTPPMAFADYGEALNYAIRDLRLNHQLYIERYLRWKS